MTAVRPQGEPRVTDHRPPAPESLVHRVLRALELLAAAPRTASAVARELGVNRSTGLRLMQTLESTGYVSRDPETKLYSNVPSRLYALAGGASPEMAWINLINPRLRCLQVDFGESAVLGIPASGKITYSAFYPSLHPIRVTEHIGTVRPMHASALGRAYLSALGEERLTEELAQITYEDGTHAAPANARELRTRLGEVRRAGYAVEQGETLEGVTCVAAPAWVGGRLIGAIGTAAPSTRLTDSKIVALGQRLAEEGSRFGSEGAPQAAGLP